MRMSPALLKIFVLGLGVRCCSAGKARIKLWVRPFSIINVWTLAALEYMIPCQKKKKKRRGLQLSSKNAVCPTGRWRPNPKYEHTRGERRKMSSLSNSVNNSKALKESPMTTVMGRYIWESGGILSCYTRLH